MGLLNKFRQDNKKRDLTQEVTNNLIALFNTKQSFGAWQKGLGLKSYYSGKTSSDVIEEIISDIRYNIEHFEKRIKIIDIQPKDSTNILQLSFQIQCQLGGSFHSFYIGFNHFQNTIQVEVEE